MGSTRARLLLALEDEHDVLESIEAIVTTHAAYMDAIERVLGAPPRSFYRAEPEAVHVWVSAMRGKE